MASTEAATTGETKTWLAEHERTLHRLRSQVTELENSLDAERDLAIPQAVAAAGMFALPLILTMPWLAAAGSAKPTSGWTLLLAPLSGPLPAGAVYFAAAAIVLQAIGLALRNRCAAMIAAVGTALASLATITFIFTATRAQETDAAAGAVVGVVVLLILSITWGAIAELRRWSGSPDVSRSGNE